MAEWISVKERSPELGQAVLVVEQNVVGVARLIKWGDEELFFVGDDNYTQYPSHWMPLPEPPKEVQP